MKFQQVQLTLLSVVLLILTGCGSGDPQSTQSVDNNLQQNSPSQIKQKSIEVFTRSTLERAIINEEKTITVPADALNISKSDNSNNALMLKSVTAMNNEACRVTNINGLSYSFIANKVGECLFKYIVAPVNSATLGESENIARVAVSETYTDYDLPVISEVAFVGSSVSIDLAYKTGLWKENGYALSGYQLQPSIEVLGNAKSKVSISGQEITVSPNTIDDAGVTRIYYSLSDGSSTKLGVIDVAISEFDGVNTRPKAELYKHNDTVQIDKSFQIDLRKYISDVDNDTLSVVKVTGFNVDTKIIAPEYLEVEITPHRGGTHTLAYTISDGLGGYATNLIVFNTQVDMSVINQDWDDIIIEDPEKNQMLRFSGPVSQLLADHFNLPYNAVYTEDGSKGPRFGDVVRMKYPEARQYCSIRNGRLPTGREIELLIASVEEKGGVYAVHNWPAWDFFGRMTST